MKKSFVIIAVLAATIISVAGYAQKKSGDAALGRNLTTFNAIVKELQDNYVDSIAPDRAFKEAIDALLETVDPYTVYYPAGRPGTTPDHDHR